MTKLIARLAEARAIRKAMLADQPETLRRPRTDAWRDLSFGLVIR